MLRLNNSQLLELFANSLGQENVITDEAELSSAQTATFKTSQKIIGILRPQSVEDIQKAIKLAKDYKSPLYTVSTGKNWSYGSRVPLTSGSLLMELSGMNRIVDYNEQLGYVTVEPGVTQQQLYDFLEQKKSSFSLGPTGSAPDTSIIGNICERGLGMGPYSFRAHYISALEVILPSGACIHTGYGRFSNARAATVYPEGLGPSFADMFIQSNLGIITKLTFFLAPTPVYTQFIDLFIPEDKYLPKYLEITRTFNFFTTSRKSISFHNDLQMLSAKTQYPWSMANGITPLPSEILTRLKRDHDIRFAWRGVIEMYGYTQQELAAQVDHFMSLAGDIAGVELSQIFTPDTLDSQPSDIGNGIYWRMKTKPPKMKNPDIDGCGNIRLSLAVPFTIKDINNVVRMVKKTVAQFGYEPFIEVHCISERSVLIVTSLAFDRTIKGQDKKALNCHDTLLRAVMKQGYYPYRLNIQAAPFIPKSSDDYDSFQKTIKQTLDPEGILSPGRYEHRSN